MGRPQLNRDIFARGLPEPIAEIKRPEWSATLYDLLTAYATQRQRSVLSRVRFKKRTVWSLAEARAALERLIGQSADWSRIDVFLISYVVEPALRVDGICVLVCLRARTGARGRCRNSSERVIRADLTCASASARMEMHRRMTHKKTHKETKSMPSAAKKLVIVA